MGGCQQLDRKADRLVAGQVRRIVAHSWASAVVQTEGIAVGKPSLASVQVLALALPDKIALVAGR